MKFYNDVNIYKNALPDIRTFAYTQNIAATKMSKHF